jgi:membrane protein required for colicin V production
MNWVDGVLLVLLVAAAIIGSKKGLIRELMALAVLCGTVIVTLNYIDIIATKVFEQLGGSPIVTAILSFIILLALIYAVFRVLAFLFYKFANLQKLGKKDQLGGALVGAVRGWIIISFVVFLAFLMPMPEKFYLDFEQSFFGPTFARTLPVMYESTATLHPENPDFMAKVENTLIQTPTGTMSNEDRAKLSETRELIYHKVYQIDRFFGDRE